MANNSIITIKQLSGRLEASSSSERLDALSELQSLSRASPDLVGEYALPAVLQILRSQGTAEEYSEALDLLSRLVSTKDQDAARANTARILGTDGNVELLLDLLEHSDLMVGVMTSQILTELHSKDGAGLEAQIQFCPDGMNKLLQRLPDNSREEVRNQAIVFVQQLTSQNEEMKKTVAFNEGFEILFRIINDEGGSGDAGLVVSDCLKICNNILLGSETCQRLFFGMGVEWILRLSDFFNPMILERMAIDQGALMGEDSPMSSIGSWFLESNRLSCAVLALAILNSALSNVNKKHQTVIVESAAQVLQSAIHWLARNGPKELVTASLCFLDAVVANNSIIAQSLAAMLIKLAPNVKSRNVASDAEVASLTFAWRPLLSDERRCISLLSLLAERYVFPARPWKVISAGIIHGELGFSSEYDFSDASVAAGESAMTPFLLLFSRILSTDTMVSDTLVQYVLAPPPPNAYGAEDEDDVFQPMTVQLETLRPVCSILLQNTVQICEKLMSGHFQYSGSMGSSQTDLDCSERVAHVLTVVFMNGSLLARELSTAITTSHCLSSADGKLREVDADNKAVLPFILAAVGKAARLQGGLGYALVKAILIWMSTVVCGCERAVRLVFEDPANLFVVDLATSSSEAAGVPTFVQISACFFLGCAFLALPPDAEDGEKESNEGSSLLRRKTFLTVIDSRIGLNRFTEMLKRPLLGSRKASNNQQDNFFLLPGFRAFYEAHVEKIKDLIFEMYASGSNNGAGGNMESIHLQKIAIQTAKIKELEDKLQASSFPHHSNGHGNNGVVVDSSELSRLREINAHVDILQAQLTESNSKFAALQTQADWAEETINKLTEEKAAILADVRTQSEHRNKKEESLAAEILTLKESIVNESEQRRAIQAQADQKEKKISLLESELTALRNNQFKESTIASQQVQSKLESLQATIKTCEKQLQDALREKQELSLRFDEEHLQSIDCQARLSISEETNRSLKTQLDAAHAQVHAQETHVHGLEQTNKELQRSIQAVREELASLNASSSQFANEELAKITHQVSEFKSAIDQTLAAAEDFAECVYLDYEPYVGEDEDSVQKFVHTVDLIDKLRLAFTSVVAECSDLAESVRITDLAGAEGSLERNTDCCRRMAERLIAMEEVSVSLHELRLSMSEYEAKFCEIEQEKGRLEERELELTTANKGITQQLSAAHAQVKQANDEVAKLQTSILSLETRLQEADDDQKQLQKVLTEIKSERDRFKLLHEQSTTHSASFVGLLQATERQLREQIASLEAELQAAQAAAERRQLSLDSLTNTVHEKDQAIEVLRQEYQNTKNILQAKDEQLAHESNQLRSLQQRLTAAHEESNLFRGTVAERDATITQLRTSVSILEDDKHRIQQQLSEKTVALNDAESRQAYLSKELAELAALSHAKETQSTLSKESKDHLEVSLQSVRDQLKMAYADMEAEKHETNNLLSALKTLQSTHELEVNEMRQEIVRGNELIIELRQRVGVLDESVGEKLDTIRLKDEKIKALALELEHIHKQCAGHEKEIAALKDLAEKERAAAKTISEKTSYSQAMQLQDIEIKRLSATVNGLSKELLQKEHELRNFYTQSARKEGEISSLKVEMEALREQVSTLRAEALNYSQQLTEYERKLYDLTLQNQHLQNVQLEKAKTAVTSKSLTDNNVLSHTERLQVTEAMYTLHSFVSKQSDKYSVDFLRLNEGQFFTTHDLATLVKAVKDALQQVLDKIENQVEGFSRLIEVKEREISHLRSLQLSSSAMNTTISPIKGSNDAQTFFRAGGSGEKSRASYVTPARPGRSAVEPSSAGSWTGGGQPNSAGRRAVSVTPAAKETARLHLELARERKKLDELQEEHSDLLGMLAQQEVELSIFKKKLLLSLGPDKIASVEEEAKSSVEQMYGTYTNFRPTESV